MTSASPISAAISSGDHTTDQLAERYRMTPAQALQAVMRHETTRGTP